MCSVPTSSPHTECGTCLLCTSRGFMRGVLRGMKGRNWEDVQTNVQLLLFQPETSVIVPLSKNFAWNKERGKKTPKLVSFFGVREFKEDSVNHSCRKSLIRVQESDENVFTSVLSSGSIILKSLGDRKSQNSAGRALVQSWPVTRFSHSSSRADSLMQKSWVNIKFSTIHDVYFGFGFFFSILGVHKTMSSSLLGLS